MKLVDIFSDGKRITYTYQGNNSMFVITYPIGSMKYKKLMDRD